MRNIINIILIIGFVVVDFLIFHDFFKAREMISPPQYLTGLLSIPVLIMSGLSLFKK